MKFLQSTLWNLWKLIGKYLALKIKEWPTHAKYYIRAEQYLIKNYIRVCIFNSSRVIIHIRANKVKSRRSVRNQIIIIYKHLWSRFYSWSTRKHRPDFIQYPWHQCLQDPVIFRCANLDFPLQKLSHGYYYNLLYIIIE